LDKEAESLNQRAGVSPPVMTADWLAARVVGRDTDGNLLGPKGPLPPKGGQPDNDVLFFRDDRMGFGCPIGSHVRRAYPRDGFAYEPAACPDLLRAANNHRILRRGRKFGQTIDDPRKPDNEDRGLLFICVNTDIVRQFEFVQQNWLLNPNFATLFNEVDPLVGPGPMTLPTEPLRRTVDVETYVTFAGGEYFFTPSLKALSYFEILSPRCHSTCSPA
jgi:deferrochelatase/peroxidase EfeB